MKTTIFICICLMFFVGCQPKHHYTCMTDRECEIEEEERIEREAYYQDWYLDHLEGEQK